MRCSLRYATVLLLCATMCGCGWMGSFWCVDQTQSKVMSPDGKSVAEVIVADCGAPAHSTKVRVRRTRWPAHEAYIFRSPRIHHINLSWSNNQALNIDCADCVPRFVARSDPKWLDVNVQYKLEPPVDFGAK